VAQYNKDGWGYDIYVNGNQDGKWETYTIDNAGLSPNYDFGTSGGNPAHLCRSYIIKAYEQNPDNLESFSRCFFSPGRVDVSLVPAVVNDNQGIGRGWKKVTFTIPDQDLFWDKHTANVLVNIYDNLGNRYLYGKLSAPFIISRH